MGEFTRRRMLGAAAAGAMAAALPPNVLRALAEPAPQGGSLKDIKHVVLLMQENRSFDHYFGTMNGVRGFSDPKAMKLPSGKNVFHQPDPDDAQGELLPFRLNSKKTSAQALGSLDHSWRAQHSGWHGGKMDRWIPARAKEVYDPLGRLELAGAKAPYTMGYFVREDIPFHFALADAFTVLDNYFCSVMGSTWPNRLMYMTGTIDPGGSAGGPITDTGDSAMKKKQLHWTTYPERLEKAGVSWKIYHQGDDFGCNMPKYFKQFANASKNSPLYKKALKPGPADEFEQDAKNDRLPTVSWIVMPAKYCEHPDKHPADGAAYVASKIDAIAANPEVWRKTAFILNYDENDGLFDHVPPPAPPKGTKKEYITKKGHPHKSEHVGPGFRVPAMVVSPWTAGGWVGTEQFDHTSTLRFLERITGVKEPNISDWRRANFGDLTSVFRFDSDAGPPQGLPDAKKIAKQVDDFLAKKPPYPKVPKGKQDPPKQEPGKRPQRP